MLEPLYQKIKDQPGYQISYDPTEETIEIRDERLPDRVDQISYREGERYPYVLCWDISSRQRQFDIIYGFFLGSNKGQSMFNFN